jgi:hypothetical protein
MHAVAITGRAIRTGTAFGGKKSLFRECRDESGYVSFSKGSGGMRMMREDAIDRLRRKREGEAQRNR